MLLSCKPIDLNSLWVLIGKQSQEKIQKCAGSERYREKNTGAHLFPCPGRGVASCFLCVPVHYFPWNFTLSGVYYVLYSTIIGPVYQMCDVLEICKDDITFADEKREFSKSQKQDWSYWESNLCCLYVCGCAIYKNFKDKRY